jgi:hypothetical protein
VTDPLTPSLESAREELERSGTGAKLVNDRDRDLDLDLDRAPGPSTSLRARRGTYR